jgi:UDP-N-acetyl-D-mannosaminuronate dehydrogenase
MNGQDACTRLVEAIQDRTARVAVMGQGYVRLPLAVERAQAGYAIVGVDADPDRVTPPVVDSRSATWGIPAPTGMLVRP